MSVSITSNEASNRAEIEDSIAVTLRLLLEGIHQESTPITPMRPAPTGGTLRAEVLKTVESDKTGVIKWYAPYAWYQERGFTSGPVRNYSTEGTHAHFAEDAVKKGMENLEYYARLGGLVR